jgi:hypothetical protein
MDIFYYWQKLEQNLKNGEVGYFGSNNTKIVQLAERLPKRIWVFKTPKGMKGSIQLVLHPVNSFNNYPAANKAVGA